MATTLLRNSPTFTTAIDDPLLPFLRFYSLSSLFPFSSHTRTIFYIFTNFLHFVNEFRSIKKALEDSTTSSTQNLSKLLRDCINKFKNNHSYRNDPRFLKIWFLYVIIFQLFLPKISINMLPCFLYSSSIFVLPYHSIFF